DGGPATDAEMVFPGAIARDTAGNLFIADEISNNVRRVDAATGIITTVAGDGAAGSGGDGSAATSAELNQPYGIALDAAGDLYISERSGHRVRRVDAATGIIG